VPRARLEGPDGQTTEWRSQALRAYQRRTLAADALIASAYLAGTNTRGSSSARLGSPTIRSFSRKKHYSSMPPPEYVKTHPTSKGARQRR
jgi:hypothetical protein